MSLSLCKGPFTRNVCGSVNIKFNIVFLLAELYALSVEIFFSMKSRGGRRAEDVQMTRERDFGRDFTEMTYVICMSSACRPEACMSFARNNSSA